MRASGPLTGWALALRIARRDALRHRARSVLTLVMIALPVLAVTTADVLIQTNDVSGRESVERRMGAAERAVAPLQTAQSRVATADQTLARIDAQTEAARAAVTQAQAGLDAAQAQLRNARTAASCTRARTPAGTSAGVVSRTSASARYLASKS